MVYLNLGASRPWNILLLMLLFVTVALVTQNIFLFVMTFIVSLFSIALAVYLLIQAYPLELMVMDFLDPFHGRPDDLRRAGVKPSLERHAADAALPVDRRLPGHRYPDVHLPGHYRPSSAS
ncbi:unnamed protein product [Prorocentrum cordatum]|uniref:PRA1 family protein n=1 Tax=Prorocentrum cordatum TaxID=2364126 RepID=A0ABN9RED1_9DINO|nr:unnamed protein product [Polarella glacialis]